MILLWMNCHKLNIDPIDLRLKNTWKKGSKTPTDEPS